MTREELLRILDFADANRDISEVKTALSTVDPRWNVISYAMRRHLEGKLLTVTSAAMAANVPYGTAMRRISELLDAGLLHKRPRSRTGKSFSLHPTRKLIEEFESFAMQLKEMVGSTFGFNAGDGKTGDFYFGGYYMASRILPYPNAMRIGVGSGRSFRILCSVDPTFRTLAAHATTLSEFCGTTIEVTNLPLDTLHAEIMINAGRPVSRYDLVAIDLPWTGQLADAGVIEPLDGVLAEAGYNPSDFHSTAFTGSSWRDRQYGLPIQPTVEMLFCRSDMFEEAGLPLPRTTTDVLQAARTMHRSSMTLAGIVMNFGRGTPVAHTFLQTLADFGQPVINLSPLGDGWDVSQINGENYRPMLDTGAARETAEFLLELAAFAHKDSLLCDWDRRIRIFAQGQAAMTYGWSVRAAQIERDATVPAHGKVRFAPHPHAPGAATVSPLGGFSLAMPKGLSDERRRASWRVMVYLTRPELLKWYVMNGNLTSPRFSTSADPEVQAASPLIGAIDGMARRGELQTWPRPPVPEFSDLLAVLGDEIHVMLRGDIPPQAALANAQNRIDAIMRENGRY